MAIRIVFDENVADRFDVDFGDRLEPGLWRPRIICDGCGETIHQGTEAHLHFRTEPGAEQGLPRFTHERCAEAFLSSQEGEWATAGLSYFPIQLANALDDRNGKRIFDLAPRLPGTEPDLIGFRAASVPARPLASVSAAAEVLE